jgi:hypothetical protein
MLIQLQASTNEKNKQFAAEQKQIDIKKAKFDKAASIAKIVTDTALAEVKALDYLSNPVTAAIYPGIAALIGAIGAAELATAIAQPIPTYAKGTDFHKGGPALYGEAGQELVMEPGKEPRLTSGATIGNLQRGTKIIPNDELNKMILQNMMVSTARLLEPKDTEVQDAIMKAAGMTVEAIRRSNRKTVINNKIDPRFAAYIGQQVFGHQR